MRFKAGLVVGLGVGYVLGARAGRERYEQLRRSWDQLMGSPTVQRAAGRTKAMAGDQARRSLYAVQHGVERAGSAVKERLGKESDEDSASESWPGPSEQVPPPHPKGQAPPDVDTELGT